MAPHRPENNPWITPKPPEKSRRKHKAGRKSKKGKGKTPPAQPSPPFWYRIVHAFGTDPKPHRTFCVLITLLLAMWLAKGFYKIEPGQNPVVVHMGDFTKTVSEPGWHYDLPAPFVSMTPAEKPVDIGKTDKVGKATAKP